jgi:hypothetical protein
MDRSTPLPKSGRWNYMSTENFQLKDSADRNVLLLDLAIQRQSLRSSPRPLF